MRSSLADGRGERRTERQQQLGDHADHVRDELRQHYDDHHLFDDFWIDHPHAHYRFHQNPVFWTWASFNTVRAFLPWNWGNQVYYDYGTGGNVYYQGDTVYVGDTAVPAEQYAEHAASVEGMVDQKSQRAAWTIVGKNTPIVETGISNLTMNESRVLVHFADGRTPQWLLVRIEEPQGESAPQ